MTDEQFSILLWVSINSEAITTSYNGSTTVRVFYTDGSFRYITNEHHMQAIHEAMNWYKDGNNAIPTTTVS